jgi:hypothetical protein
MQVKAGQAFQAEIFSRVRPVPDFIAGNATDEYVDLDKWLASAPCRLGSWWPE